MNKLHQFFYILIEFIIILTFFAIIPIFSVTNENNELSFSIFDILYFGILSLVLYILPIFIGKIERPEKNKTKSIIIFFVSIAVLILMLIIQVFLSYLQNIIGVNQSYVPKIDFSIIFLLTVFIRAAFEEILFRYYFIERKKYFISLFPKKILNIILEISFILLFGICHLPNGIFSVLNGIFAGILLRLLYKFSNNKIYYNIITHFIYNLIIFYF